MAMVCHLPGCDGIDLPGDTISDYLKHQRTAHLHIDLTGPGQDWHERAIAAVVHLAKTRDTFTFYDVAQIAGEPLNPKSDWGRFATEVHHAGIAEPCGYTESKRPGSAKSAVKVWRRPTTPKENAAA